VFLLKLVLGASSQTQPGDANRSVHGATVTRTVEPTGTTVPGPIDLGVLTHAAILTQRNGPHARDA